MQREREKNNISAACLGRFFLPSSFHAFLCDLAPAIALNWRILLRSFIVTAKYRPHVRLLSCFAHKICGPLPNRLLFRLNILLYWGHQNGLINFRQFTLAPQESHINGAIFPPSATSCVEFTASASYSCRPQGRPQKHADWRDARKKKLWEQNKRGVS